MSTRRYDGRVIFITGGAVGFGRAFARAFAEEGASVALADIDTTAAEETAAALRADGFSALAVTCDVSDENQVELAVATAVTEFGGVDVLLNNAGLHLLKYNQPFAVLPRDDLRSLLAVNVVGVVNCSIACRDTMRERGHGAICNISSIAGHMPTSPYGVSKLAVRGLTQAFAAEFAPDGIRVNAISPGLMATENALADLPDEMVRDFVDNRQLVHRTGQMSDIVTAVLYLCSDEAGFITGETLKVSGGYPLGV
jgi:NAD(P)-dependent dehydrogenase (short-subunit alcohol dehydrogenase family)